jgi:hypothetical protein
MHISAFFIAGQLQLAALGSITDAVDSLKAV